MAHHCVCLRVAPTVLVVAIGLTMATCSRPVATHAVDALPMSPSVPGRFFPPDLIGGSSGLSAPTQTLFPLLNGIFTITTGAGDRLTGTYVGEVTAPLPGRDTVRLQLTVTGGSGVFQGATGTLEGKGSGAFVSEGNFVLTSLSGVISTNAAPAGAIFRATVVGASALSCSATDRILLTLRGQGTVAMVARVDVELSSEIGNTGCFSRSDSV